MSIAGTESGGGDRRKSKPEIGVVGRGRIGDWGI